jgi:alkaline phosphatase D
VACDLPLGLIVPDGPTAFEAFAQGTGPPLGREHEIAALLSALRSRRVGNVLFVTADVHYAAAHRYQPERATFVDFDPFWELVAGPLHAGTFGPNALDPTFGPEVVFQRAPKPGQKNLAPWDGMQSFGTLRIDGKTRSLTASLHDGEGAILWQTTIEAVNRRGRGP